MSPPEATRRPSSLSNLLLWGCMGCVCLPLKSAGNADADGVPIIHKTPSVQPSLLRLQQQNIKERCWIFSGNGRSLWSLLVCFLVTYCSHCKSNWFWSQCYFKVSYWRIKTSINVVFKNIYEGISHHLTKPKMR